MVLILSLRCHPCLQPIAMVTPHRRPQQSLRWGQGPSHPSRVRALPTCILSYDCATIMSFPPLGFLYILLPSISHVYKL